jgi:hypothetical protein
LDLFPSAGEGARETPTLLGPLERANLNHWTTYVSITTAKYIPEITRKIYNKNCDKACTDLKLRTGIAQLV